MFDALPATASDSVTEFLGLDHRRLDTILADVKRWLAAADVPRAAERFSEFRAGLDHHIDAEEKVLFPAFEASTGTGAGGPTQVMRLEHIELRKLMAAVAGGLALDGAGVSTPMAALTARIYAHNGKEERILYPAADRAAGDASARRALVRELQSL